MLMSIRITEMQRYDWVFPWDNLENEQLATTTAGRGIWGSDLQQHAVRGQNTPSGLVLMQS